MTHVVNLNFINSAEVRFLTSNGVCKKNQLVKHHRMFERACGA